MIRALFLGSAIALLAACADGAKELLEPVEPIGTFKLGHAIVLAPNLTKGPLSRDATKEEWIAAVDGALEERFRRYTGPDYYHIGVSVEGYVLALPGIPLVYSPKSALILRVTAFEDATQSKLNEEPEQITVLESISGDTLLGSGLTQTKDVQMRNLSANAALQIEKWMRRMQKDKGWFGGPGAGVPVAPASAEAPTATPTEPPEPQEDVSTSAAPDSPLPPVQSSGDVLPPLPPAIDPALTGPLDPSDDSAG